MQHHQDDRRAERSRELILDALRELIAEKSFEKITVQEIVDRAGVGRTTFYAHFQSKEDVFLSGHQHLDEVIVQSVIPNDGIFRPDVPAGLVAFADMMHNSRDTHFFLTWGSGSEGILPQVQDRIAEKLETRLHQVFQEADSLIPFAVLAQHLAGSIFAISEWWIEKGSAYPPPEIARMLHQINLMVLKGALGVGYNGDT
jgi:AcrR family transcriptional regulator